MRAGWRVVRLGDVCSFEKVLDLHAGLPYVGLENIESGTGRLLGATNAVAVKSTTFRFSQAHVLYGRLRPYLNKVLLPDFEGHCSTEIFPIRTGSEMLRAYLFHWLAMDATVKLIDATSTGARMPRANMNAVLDFELPVPPLAEQNRIVSILDEAFEGIATAKANAEKNLLNARDLFDGHLQAVFSERNDSWVDKPVQYWVDEGVLAKPQDGNHGEIHPTKSDYVESGVPFIMAADMIGGTVDTESCRFIAKEQADTLRVGFAKSGDVLLSHKGTIGRVAILETAEEYVMLTPQVTYYRSLDNSRLHNGFLYYVLMSPEFQSTMNRIAGAGSTRAYIGITRQLEQQMPLPPIDVQLELAARLWRVDEASNRLAEVYRAKLVALEELRQSILQQAFAGQLASSKRDNAVCNRTVQTTTPEFAANVISLAHAHHERQHRERSFGRVKEQKTLHLVEAIGKIDLGRQPIRDAAGPNDFHHMLKAEEWARTHNFFEMVRREGGYDFKKLSAFDEHLARARQALKPYLPQIDRVNDLLVPMDKEDAEVFATVHAAWNNLVIDGRVITDDAIVSAARGDWHADKLRIPEQKFRASIALIRQQGLVPDGTAKYVGGQQSLL